MTIDQTMDLIDDVFYYDDVIFTHEEQKGDVRTFAIQVTDVHDKTWHYLAWVNEEGRVQLAPMDTAADVVNCMICPAALLAT